MSRVNDATTHHEPAADLPVIDSLGKPCPTPVIDLARAVSELTDGDEVLLLADDPGAKVDVPVWCRMKRHELVAVDTEGGAYRFRVRRCG